MLRSCMMILFLLSITFSFSAYARQSGGGGGDDLKGVCELAGGTWTGSEGGNWACCWADWGCYGCYNRICKMQCRTQRCRDANNMRNAGTGTRPVKGLVAPGTKAPIAPMRRN